MTAPSRTLATATRTLLGGLVAAAMDLTRAGPVRSAAVAVSRISAVVSLTWAAGIADRLVAWPSVIPAVNGTTRSAPRTA